MHKERKESEQHLMCKQERKTKKEKRKIKQVKGDGWKIEKEKESAKRFGVKNYELGHDRDRVESIKSAIKRVVLINLLLRQLKYLLRHQSQTMMMTMIFARWSELETKFFVYFSISLTAVRAASQSNILTREIYVLMSHPSVVSQLGWERTHTKTSSVASWAICIHRLCLDDVRISTQTEFYDAEPVV